MNSSCPVPVPVLWMEGEGPPVCTVYRVCPRPSFIVAICLVPTYRTRNLLFMFYLLFIASSLLCNGFGHFFQPAAYFFAFSQGRLIPVLFRTESVFLIYSFCCLTANAVSDSQCSAASDSQCRLSDSQCRVRQLMPIVWIPSNAVSDSQCRLSASQ